MGHSRKPVIDPIQSLAFSIQANPGVYAVLLGSGVSRSAKIPTGWEVTLDLIRKLAKLCGEVCDPDPELWYENKFGRSADYSNLLDEIVRTPAERQQLLRPYWEPNDQEREEGEKQPTPAHRAIAALASRGFIRVILTTNFDRLMETALRDEEVVPTILSSPDQVRGALPLIHTQCCVIKLHGDYLDTRIRNTPAELDQYPPEFDRLLDRIFDEFGLIVCGWSAEWDGALRAALERAPSRRFTTYWTLRDKLREETQRLIGHRRAQVIRINDADDFFQNVQQFVESIEAYSRPHPLSTEAAVASLKRYISEPRYRIQLSDLVNDSVERVVEIISGEAFPMDGPRPTTESVTERVRHYEAACSTLLSMAPIGGFWAEEEHYSLWQEALERLGSTEPRGGYSLWLRLRRYPATLLLYALGLGAVAANRLKFLNRMLTATLREEHQRDVPAGRELPAFCIGRQDMRILEGMERHYVPLNDWIHETLRPYLGRIIPDDNRYTMAFDKLELLMSLNNAYHKDWVPPGAFGYRHRNNHRIFQQIRGSLSTEQDESPFVTCGIFGGTAGACEQALATVEDAIPGWRFG